MTSTEFPINTLLNRQVWKIYVSITFNTSSHKFEVLQENHFKINQTLLNVCKLTNNNFGARYKPEDELYFLLSNDTKTTLQFLAN